MRLRLLSEAHTNVVLRVITQEPDDTQAALVQATAPLTARRSDVYLPPLPPVLLEQLGVDADARRAATESVQGVKLAASAAAERSAMDGGYGGISRRGGGISMRDGGGGGGLSIRSPMAAVGAAVRLERRGSGGGGNSGEDADEPMQITRQISLDRGVSFGQLGKQGLQEHERRFSDMHAALSPTREYAPSPSVPRVGARRLGGTPTRL